MHAMHATTTTKKILDSYGKRYFKIGTNWYCSAGILFWRQLSTDNQIQYLVMHTDNKNKIYRIEEFGGKSNSKVDMNIRNVAIRETIEESNGLFGNPSNNKHVKPYTEAMLYGSQYLENYMQSSKDIRIIYNSSCKYVTYVIEFPRIFNIQDIGEYEIHENTHIKRQFMWMTKQEILDSNCINRLRYVVNKTLN
jgi:hypothetical protein